MMTFWNIKDWPEFLKKEGDQHHSLKFTWLAYNILCLTVPPNEQAQHCRVPFCWWGEGRGGGRTEAIEGVPLRMHMSQHLSVKSQISLRREKRHTTISVVRT
jgi:hypothetical protein